MDRPAVDFVVSSLYQAAAGQTPWEGAMEGVAKSLRLLLAQLVGVDMRAGRVLFSFEGGTGSAEATLDYSRTYHRVDPNAQLALGAQVGEYVSMSETLGDAVVETHPFYQDYLIPYGGRYVHGAKVYQRDDMVVFLGLHRALGSTPIVGLDTDTARQFVFHVVHAFELYMRLRPKFAEAAIGKALLDRLTSPVALLDARRTVVVSNSAARELFTRYPDIAIDSNGILRCRDRTADTELGLTVKAMQLSGHAGLSTEAPLERKVLPIPLAKWSRPLIATLIAVRPEASMGAFGSEAMAMVLIQDTNRAARIDPFALSAAFDLTPAEAKVASQLVAGLSPAEIAAINGTSINTTKSHIRAVQEKLDVRRTPELVAILSGFSFVGPVGH